MREGNTFKMKAANDETTSALFSQIAGILGVGKRSDGKYHLADICQSYNINPWARNKPFRFYEYNFGYDPNNPTPAVAARAAARGDKSVNSGAVNGFGNTRMITPSGGTIPHAVYEYQRPRGANYNEPNRLRDFDNYNHNAVPPMKITWMGDKVSGRSWNKISIAVNGIVQGWDNDTCLRVDEVTDSNVAAGAVYALYITKANNSQEYWLLPTRSPINNSSTSQIIYLEFAASEDKFDSDYAVEWNKTVFPDLASASSSDQYQMVVVATPTQYTGQAIKTSQSVYSLEFLEGIDRITLPVQAAIAGLDGLAGSLNTTWYRTRGTKEGNFVPYSLNGTTLRVRLNTTADWDRTSAYIEVKLSLQGTSAGYITTNTSSAIVETITKGATISIGKSSSGDYTIADLSNYILWLYDMSYVSVNLNYEIVAWLNANKLNGENKVLATGTITFNHQ